MSGPQHVRLLSSGRGQTVSLPDAFRFDGDEATIRREGDSVILEPVRPRRPRTGEHTAERSGAVRADEGFQRASRSASPSESELEYPAPRPLRTVEDVDAMFARLDALGPSSLEYPPEPEPQRRDHGR